MLLNRGTAAQLSNFTYGVFTSCLRASNPPPRHRSPARPRSITIIMAAHLVSSPTACGRLFQRLRLAGNCGPPAPPIAAAAAATRLKSTASSDLDLEATISAAASTSTTSSASASAADADWLAADAAAEEHVERLRNKSRLLPQHRRQLSGQRPYAADGPQSWIHTTVKYQRMQFGRYGAGGAAGAAAGEAGEAGVDARLCWPTVGERATRAEWERVAFPHTLPEVSAVARGRWPGGPVADVVPAVTRASVEIGQRSAGEIRLI